VALVAAVVVALRPDKSPSGVAFAGTPTVGALFSGSPYGAHFCTASVVASPAGDVVVTAAHCVSGSGSDLVFAPDYRRGFTPFGVWNVVAAYGEAGWLAHQDPREDVAFLIVADRLISGRHVRLEDMTGAEHLGPPPAAGAAVTVVGYRSGRDDLPIRCSAKVYLDDGYPAFDCDGFSGGTSGSPWMRPGGTGVAVVAVSGGRFQGGCEASTSYAAPFSSGVIQLYHQAMSGASPSSFPLPAPSGC
jgi:Trypsin-like peptidase domain